MDTAHYLDILTTSFAISIFFAFPTSDIKSSYLRCAALRFAAQLPLGRQQTHSFCPFFRAHGGYFMLARTRYVVCSDSSQLAPEMKDFEGRESSRVESSLATHDG